MVRPAVHAPGTPGKEQRGKAERHTHDGHVPKHEQPGRQDESADVVNAQGRSGVEQQQQGNGADSLCRLDAVDAAGVFVCAMIQTTGGSWRKIAKAGIAVRRTRSTALVVCVDTQPASVPESLLAPPHLNRAGHARPTKNRAAKACVYLDN